MRNIRRLQKAVLLFSVVIIVVLSGCAPPHYPMEMSQKGIVAWSYESRIAPSNGNTDQRTISIVVQDIQSEAPSMSGRAMAIFAMLPVLSLSTLAVPFHQVNINEAELDTGGNAWKGGIRRWEIAEILEQELRKSGIAKKVVLARENSAADYEVRGSVNFVDISYGHFSGFGAFVYFISLFPIVTLPEGSEEMLCDAHFEVVSRDNKTLILSKDYHAETSFHLGTVYSSYERSWSGYGKEVFPQIVERFIGDLKALPKSAWSR
jgi:hypothetical protein